MRSSRIEALGSIRVSLQYINPGQGIPCMSQYACELGQLTFLGRDMSNGKGGIVCLLSSDLVYYMYSVIFFSNGCWRVRAGCE